MTRPSTVLWSGLILSLWLMWLLGSLIANQLQKPTSLLSNAQIPTEKPHTTLAPQTSYLFGKPELKASPNLSHVATTRLDLKLVGIIETGQRNLAIIENKGKSLALLEGDPIEPGVVLLRVFDNEAIISNQGRHEKLILQNNQSNALLDSGAEQTLSTDLSISQKEQLKTAVLLVRRSPLNITQYVRFQPLNTNGHMTGLMIKPAQDIALFKALGFESDDVIIQVNGHSVTEMASNPKLMQGFITQNTFSVELKRRGVLKSLYIDLSQLTI